jgi:hypothetical protein
MAFAKLFQNNRYQAYYVQFVADTAFKHSFPLKIVQRSAADNTVLLVVFRLFAATAVFLLPCKDRFVKRIRHISISLSITPRGHF